MTDQVTLTDGTRSLVFPASTEHGWFFHSLQGWYGQTSDKVPSDERPQAHGAFARSRSLRTSRAVTLKVGYRNGTPAEVEAAVMELSSFGVDGPITVAVEDQIGRFQRKVSVDSIADTDNTRWYTGDMTVGMVADDPHRYAIESEVPWLETGPPTAGLGRTWPAIRPLIWPGGGSSGRITLTNTGTADSAPQLQLVGGFETALITCAETGARIGFDRLVPDGSVVTLDTDEHLATIDGQSDVSRWLRWREWELVPAGESRSFQFDITGGTGTPLLKGRVLSAWV